MADLGCLHDVAEGLALFVHVASLETDHAVGQGVLLLLRHVLAHDLHEVGQLHDGAAHDKVELGVFLLASELHGLHVLQANGCCHLVDHTNFLCRAVDHLKMAVGEHDGQGNAREAAARAEIEYARAGFPFHEACYGERVEHMVRIEVVDIFS